MSPLRRRLVRVGVVLGVLVALVGGYYIGLYFVVDRSVDRVAALSPDAPEILAPQLQDGADTYLVVGSGLPGTSGPGSVTAVLARVAPGGESAALVAVPSTALVDTPECRTADGELRPVTTEPFADALLQGGPSCLVRAAQQLSGLRVDHFVDVDLGQLPDLVDAVGPVRYCLSNDLAPAGSGLTTGVTTLAGGQVGALLAADPDGTGGTQATRQQLLVAETLHQGLALTALLNPLSATGILTRAGGALTVDDDTTLGDVRSLADTLAELPPAEVQHAGLPVARIGYLPAGAASAIVLLDGAATRAVFDSLITVGELPGTDTAGNLSAVDPAEGGEGGDATGDAAGAETSASVTLPPNAVTVDVLDATAPADPGVGPGATTGAALAAQGFIVRSVAVEPAAASVTVVRHAPDALEQARVVAAAVPGSVLVSTSAVAGVQLVVAGADTSVVPVAVGAAVPETATPTPSAPATCP